MSSGISQKSAPLGFGIVGSGNIAETHAATLAQVEGAKLVGITGRNLETTGKIAAKHGVPALASLGELLDLPGLHAILVATPSGAHREPTLAALSAGKHVLCEKPLEINLSRCSEMIDCARQHQVLLGGFFPLRMGRAAVAIRQALDQGRFGKLTFLSARVKWWRDQAYYSDSSWRGTWQMDGGGALMNQGIHCVDLLGWFGGPVRSVSARMGALAHEGIEVEDTLAAIVEFEHGALGTIEAATSAYPGIDLSLEISGDRGTAVLENDRIAFWKFQDAQPSDEQYLQDQSSAVGGGASDPKAISCEGHRRQISSFCQSIRSGTPALLEGREASAAVGIVEACYLSAKSRDNTPVKYI